MKPISLSLAKNLFIILLLSLPGTWCYAQKRLTDSRTGSLYTYVYKIGDKQLLNLYKYPSSSINENELQNPIDSFKTGQTYNENKLAPGNYLQMFADKNQLQYKLIEKHSAFLHLLNSVSKTQFIITGRDGNVISSDAVVTCNGKTLANPQNDIYTLPLKDYQLLTISYQGIINFFMLDKNTYGTPTPFLKRLVSSRWQKINRLFKTSKYTSGNKQQDAHYTGFFVFNKPKYKPHDTVRFKAYIFNNKTKQPLNASSLLLKISRRYSNDDEKSLGTVNSYRKGAYESNFVITDSLDLDLDENYTLSLQDPNRKMPKDKNGDDEDDDSNKKHIIYLSGEFNYEEYELKSINFSVRTDGDENYPGKLMNVYMKAVDENGLPVPDGRVNIVLKSGGFSNYKDAHVFIPDTLWQHEVKLDPVGETRVTIPDSVFPKANIFYTLNADFYNADNEHHNEMKYLNYISDSLRLETNLSSDTLLINALKQNKSIATNAHLTAIITPGDTLFSRDIKLPYAQKLNPAVFDYHVTAGSLNTSYFLNAHSSGVQISGSRMADTVNIQVANPLHLHMWYAVYQGKKMIYSGEGDSLHYKYQTNYKGNILCAVHYIWAGDSRSVTQNIPYMNQTLTIKVKQPFSVYPGQKVTTSIQVLDNKGQPAPNVDLTAWALTSKFDDYRTPFIPYIGKIYPVTYLRSLSRNSLLTNNWSIALNWKKWSREMGLDTIEYYKFTHTDSIYRISEQLNKDDTLTQVAPFVVNKGDIIPVHILYIDEKPVYFSQSQQLQHYSFPVSSGRHTLKMRTAGYELTIKNIYVERGKKLILSIRDTITNPGITLAKMPDTLTAYETGLLNKYMLKITDNFGDKLATLAHGNSIIALNPALGITSSTNNYRNQQNELLVGPLSNNIATFNLDSILHTTFLSEPGFVYTFMPGLLKQKSVLTRYPFHTGLWDGAGITDYTQYAVNQTTIDTLWQNYLDLRSHTTSLFENPSVDEGPKGFLEIGYNETSTRYFVKNIIVYKYNDPDFMQVYPGNQTNLGNLQQGKYRLLLLLKKDEYALIENLDVKAYGKNYYRLNIEPKPRDSVSMRIARIIESRANTHDTRNDDGINNDELKLKETFNEKYLDKSGFTDNIHGLVTDTRGEPIPGATIRVKGTNSGAVASMNGNFSLRVPANGKIIVAMVGYVTQVLDISPGKYYQVKMKEQAHSLQEVVVVGYGIARKADLTGSITVVSSLEGRVAGLVSTRVSGADFMIRGNSSMNSGPPPLIVIDGMIMTDDDLKKIPVNDIENITILKDSAATALYGARAANGVLTVITKKKSDADKAANAQSGEGNIRKNFSDYAYWQPKLTTDAEGKTSFTTIFPDDITSWRTFVAGVNDGKATGVAENLIKSFNPLSASLIAPAFAVEGDELSAIGKVMNYNAIPQKLARLFYYNGTALKQDSLTVTNSKIDTLHFTATNNDSLTFKYFIKKSDGYFDGEERKIPIIKQGVEETKGIFEVLKGDTTLHLNFDASAGKVTFRAEASALPALMEETDKLRTYKYLCNEQLASKLKGLLMEKRIKTFMGEPFKHESNIKDVIKLINENGGQQGLWGWWKGTTDELWISLHVMEALLQAEHEKHVTNIEVPKITAYLVYQLESYKGQDKITCLQLLYTLHANVDYKKYIQEIEKEYQAQPQLSAYNHFRILLLKQEAGMSINTDELLNASRKTLFGNIYWGEENNSFFDNATQISTLAYKIIKNEGKHPEALDKIRGYLLEQRHNGGWRNTYESSLILETILPDVLTEQKKLNAAQLKLSGALTATVDKFPYTSTFSGGDLSVAKTGSLPVYITGYQQYWNNKPEKVSKDFTVDTWFEHNGQKVGKLKGGERVQLKARVTAHGDGEFVMIEIPIPAGCSYESKDQSRENNEVHREYFREKVSIFCRKLKQGTYTFTIDLMPRFSGLYNLNPAKAELMYFPVFYGREGMSKVEIRD